MKLHDLLSRFETALARGESLTPEEVCRDHPEMLDQFKLHARAIRGITPPSAEAVGSTMFTVYAEETASRFTVLKPHARGGLGEVYLARDESLGREVALKVMIGPAEAARRQRFEREAEITGKLQHPGIVPVYGTGVDDRGRLCHVMRFISGPTLAEAIDEFHKSGAAFTRNDPRFRGLLARIGQVAQTIAFAHSRGVVHRDLKPGNIILGDYGETLVVDWGLAKELRNADGGLRIENPPQPPATADESPSRPQFFDEATLPFEDVTQAGSMVGTPAFLSPEQARGEDVTTATDVFSLGGLLYSLLSGTAPFSGLDTAELLRRSREGDVPPLLTRRPDAPPALVAVCDKAMAKSPGDRYPDALAFAAEIDRWLADEPLSVAADPPSVRLRRWARRHRMLVASSVAALLVAAVGSLIAAVMLSGKNKDLSSAVTLAQSKEREANDSAKLAAEREEEAKANFKTASDAVDKFGIIVHDDPRLRAPQMQKLRLELLTNAANFYRQLADRRGLSNDLRARIGNAQERLGAIKFDNGDFEGAEKDFRFALAQYEAVENQDSRYFRLARASAHFWLSTIHRAHQRFDDCLAEMQKCYDLTKLARQDSQAFEDRYELLDMDERLAFARFEAKGMTPEVEAEFARLMAAMEAQAKAHPKEFRAWIMPAMLLAQSGSMNGKLKRRDEAEKAYVEALAWLARRPASVPDATGQSLDLQVQISEKLIPIYIASQREADARRIYDDGAAAAKKLIAMDPQNPYFQKLLADLDKTFAAQKK